MKSQIEINEFEDVILFAFQRTQKTLLTFSELWRCCGKAAPNLNITTDGDDAKKYFAAKIVGSMRRLAASGYVAIHTKDSGSKITHLTLTREGLNSIDNVIYTHQHKMGDQI